MPAERITVTREGERARIVVDGVEIPPDAIQRDSVDVPVDPDEVPAVHLTLIGARVDVLNTLKEGATDGTAE
ncbi:hypothetical protein [Streptomyces sp. TRM75563]|uniref:hypothetical protein n=1 Tax=Streptomyces sp. TRM75563 TaxID=2817418 RepID=UPI001F603859|nr:hypothetical protein [Streptomyces sp. TRM75563]MCI4045135.1 hypothetical protein [Streptomyces sp. TRM75563]